MNLILSLILTLSVLPSHAEKSAHLPVATELLLSVGRAWTWTYYTHADTRQFYSQERYEVIAADSSRIGFEISSRYDAAGAWGAHTRFQVDLRGCWNAFRNPRQKVAFTVNLYPLDHGSWAKEPISTPSTIFEDKYNCNPWVYRDAMGLYETRYDVVGFQTLFQQWPRAPRAPVRSYYYLDHPTLAGVAYKRTLNDGSVYMYEMVLTETSDVRAASIPPY